ncbi:MAG: hypothetical protein IJ872_00080 [Eubacterium sp.]|nr:hypothetical protein [Eubacterium sp.]
MRNSLKKVLAIVLSTIMVITAMPFATLTAFADDSAITAYNSAVAAYDAKMDGTVYTNMGSAYAAFVDANEAYDAYVYGNGTQSALNSAVNALVTATSALDDSHKWTQSTATASVYSRDSSSAISSTYAKNILYADRQDTLVDEGSNANVRVQIQYGTNNVLLYDGKNDILFPVAVFYYYDQTGFSSRKMYTMYPYKDGQTGSWDASNFPDDNEDFRLQAQWNGKMNYGTADWNAAYALGDHIPGYQKSNGSAPDGAPDGNRGKWNYFANYMKYVGGANGFSNGLKTLNLDWFAFTGRTSSANRVAHTLDNAGNIYIIDYATALNAINTKTYLADVSNYKTNGLSAYMNAYDDLTVDVASYDYASDAYGNAANVASSLASAAAVVNATTSPDNGAGYVSLRNAISASKATYADGNDDNYYPSAYWGTFKDAYEAATDNMTNLTSNGYSTSAAAQTLADRLNTAYNNLINSVQNVDTTALETAIDDAEYAIENNAYWTATSYAHADLQNVVNTAKVAVWTSVDKYKSTRAKSQTTEATVAAQLENVKAAILKLVINKDATVAQVGNYSATTAIAYAHDTTQFTPTDYANWDTVEDAVDTATQLDAAITVYADNCASAKIEEYVSSVRGIISALKNLKDAFSKMDNGELIAQGEQSEVTQAIGSPDSVGAGQDYHTNFWGYNNSVVFRTSHDAAFLPLPDSYISIWTQSGYPMGLDCININDQSTYNDDHQGQITSGGNGDNRAVSDSDIATYNFSAGLSAESEGYGKQGRLYLGSATTSNGLTTPEGSGIFVNASRVWPITGNVYATEADGTMHNTAEDISDDNHFTYDLTNVLGTFDNIDNHPNNANYGAYGAVWVDNGKSYSTQMKASTSLYVTQETSNQLKSTTKLTIDEYSFINRKFGAMVWWKYMNINTFGYTYHGFRHDVGTYSRTIQVVNVADLFRLINQCENAGYVANEYTTASWNAYATALANAKGDMDYSDKSAEWVLEQCQGRYDDLWAAKEGLVKAADRTALLQARDAVKDVYDAGQTSEAYGGPWSDESWNAFADYYRDEVVAKLNGDYSATGVRNYEYYDATGTEKSDAQKDIEARAARIIELKDALQSNADFTPLDNAVAALRTKVNEGNFTTASVAACNEALQDIEYFWYSDAERKAVYASTAADEAIAAAANAVTAAGNLLVEADADVVSSASDITAAVQDLLEASQKDPDAYDFEAVKAQIAALGATTDGSVVFTNNSYYGSLSTTSFTWQHMSDVDALVTDALSEHFKTYNINITGVTDAANTRITYTIGGQEYESTGATLTGIPYGTTIRVYAPDDQFVNWFYTYTSATSGEKYKEKYLTNDRVINFVVNGNTTFRLENETDIADTQKAKVTYANSLRTESYKVEYVNKGNITLPEAPNFAHYEFAGYTIDGTDYAAGDTVNITGDTLVIANYDYADENGITIFVANVGGSADSYVTFDTEYNKKIELSYSGLATKAKNNSGSYKVDDVEEPFAPKSSNPNKGKLYTEDSIYAYTVITGDLVEVGEDGTLFEEYIQARNDDYFEDNRDEYLGYLENAETVLTYGDTYTFYASENMVIIPYTEEQFNQAIADGFIDTANVDANGATANAGDMFNAGTKMTIVSNYVIPDGAELVEAGLLFQATRDGSVPSGDLTFGNIGKNGIVRMKSTQHTVGNQFVISPIQIRDNIKGSTINARYRAYVTYTGADGKQHTSWSKTINSAVIA